MTTESLNECDWQDDVLHENGNYLCRCALCSNSFYGHKRRVVCKSCYDKEQMKGVIKPDELKEVNEYDNY